MGLVKSFGWMLLIAGMGLMASPMMSSATGFVIASLHVPVLEPHIKFSPAIFVAGGLLALVGLAIVWPRSRSVIEKM